MFRKQRIILLNIVVNIVGKVAVIERENKIGEALQVEIFSEVFKDDGINKVYHNSFSYGEKLIFQRTLNREILLKFLNKSKLPLMIMALCQDTFFKVLKDKGQMKGQE